MTPWYKKYLGIYNCLPADIPATAVESVKARIAQLQSAAPLVSVVAIAHNEERNILACLQSLCDNVCDFPVEIMVVNNNSTDSTEQLLQSVGVEYYNETQKGPGHARQCGLNHARGKYHICIDSDTLYPPHYIATMVKSLQRKNAVCAYALWSFLPDESHSPLNLFFYEGLRDIFLNIQNLRRPELNVRGMVFAFDTAMARKFGFRTDIIRGEDGSLALELKKYGKLVFVRSRKARAITGYGTVGADGSLLRSFTKRAAKAFKKFGDIFHSASHYNDEDSNLIK